MLALSIGEGSSQGFLSLSIPPPHASIPNSPKSIVSHTYARLACRSNHLLYLRKYRGIYPFPLVRPRPSLRPPCNLRMQVLHLRLPAPRVSARSRQIAAANSFRYVSLPRELLRGVAKSLQQSPFSTLLTRKGRVPCLSSAHGTRVTEHRAQPARDGRVLANLEIGAPIGYVSLKSIITGAERKPLVL